MTSKQAFLAATIILCGCQSQSNQVPIAEIHPKADALVLPAVKRVDLVGGTIELPSACAFNTEWEADAYAGYINCPHDGLSLQSPALQCSNISLWKTKHKSAIIVYAGQRLAKRALSFGAVCRGRTPAFEAKKVSMESIIVALGLVLAGIIALTRGSLWNDFQEGMNRYANDKNPFITSYINLQRIIGYGLIIAGIIVFLRGKV
jgi:hypothetical protein